MLGRAANEKKGNCSMAGSENQESLMPAQCVKLASLFCFILKLKLRGERHGTYHRCGICQIFEIV